MVEIESLQKEVDDLEKLASDIENRGRKLITNAPISSTQKTERGRSVGPRSYHWKDLPKDLEDLQRDLTRDYQRWYSSAYPLIHNFIPEKELEFKGKYEGIMGIIQLKGYATSSSNNPIYFIKEFEIQRSILLSMPSAARMKELIK